MSNDKTTLADVQPGGRVRLGDQALSTAELRRNAHVLVLQEMRTRFTDAGSPSRTAALDAAISALSAQPSPGGQGDASHYWPEVDRILVDAYVAGSEGDEFDMIAARTAIHAALAARQPVSETDAYQQGFRDGQDRTCTVAARQPVGEPVAEAIEQLADDVESCVSDACGYLASDSGWDDYGIYRDDAAARYRALPDRIRALSAPPAQAVDYLPTFQHSVSEWMDKCFLPSLYSNMTERGDRLLEEVLELLQAHGYDKARVPTLVDYVFSRPAGDPAQEVGGVMVTLAGYCWVAGLDMHVHGHAELARISHPEVMAKIRAKQEAKNALHFDTPLPGNATPPAQAVDLGKFRDAVEGLKDAALHDHDPGPAVNAYNRVLALIDSQAVGNG